MSETRQDAALVELLREVAASGVEFEDERVRYVAVQIDRTTWLEIQRWAKREEVPERERVDETRMQRALDAFYTHLNRFGAVSGGKPEERESQERCFQLYREAVSAEQAERDEDTEPEESRC